MKVQNPQFRERIALLFSNAAFICDLGIALQQVEPGRCESSMRVTTKHMQQDRFIHAGVQATIADHTAGAAAGTLIKAEEIVLTAEFKINLLRPAVGDNLRCLAKVLKQGKSLIVVESEVFAEKNGESKMVAKAMVTLAVVTS